MHLAIGDSFGEMKGASFFYVIMFSLAAGCLLTVLSTIFINKINRFIVFGLIIFITLLFEVQLIYFRSFRDFFKWSTIGLANDVTDFWREALYRIINNWFQVILFLIPLIVYAIWGQKHAPALGTPLRVKVILLVLTILFHLTGVAAVALNEEADYYYRKTFSVSRSMRCFGVMTTTRLDIKYLMFGQPDVDDLPGIIDKDTVENPFSVDSNSSDTTKGTSDGSDGTDTDDSDTSDSETTPTPVEYGDNVLNIDFDSLIENESTATIKEMHEYFKSQKPTSKNKYTGIFKGKNLIHITLEGFSHKVVSKELFPTLYMMMNEGFVFENFYTSLWGGSTATGEYTAMTGLFYNSANCLKMSANIYLPFALGNVFNSLNYTVYAFHNHDYTYYGRHLSHPSMGYNYIAVGNGLDNLTYYWPRSDRELAEKTIDYYINKTPFHVYYITVSGHANYTFIGNAMAKRHRSEVEHLEYSDNVKAYIACQLEVEYMLQYLVQRLDEASILDDTVFVMSSDHYPYALADEDLAQLYGLDVNGIHGNFDLFRNGCVIWCSSMKEPVHIKKPASSLDIIPTVLNLFGVDYDSRLLMGTDVNSDTDPVVILNCDSGYAEWNWINSYGSYNTSTKKFTPAEGVTVNEDTLKDYITYMNSVVAKKRKFSFRTLENNYYSYVFPHGLY
ncbi:MAG: sulfatase-like hydrolase/transferase [Eubacteriales bacterium]|nr:sulfatase-like hydrolase/transferase [Clostridiales bacterium]